MDRAAEDTLIGAELDGRYRIDRPLGEGGMGAVYAGTHLLMERTVAIKVLHSDLSNDPLASKRFLREAKNTFRFDHPHCVRVTDFGASQTGVLYLVMEYLDGRTAGRELRVDGAFDSRRVTHIMAQVADALDHAHGFGLVHRDLKPDNIMLLARQNDSDYVKVLDFGLAKLYDPKGGGLSTVIAPLTKKGMTFGTPDYMSPEQARGDPLDPRSDIYSLGAVGYELLCGRPPFIATHPMEVLTAHIREQPVPPSQRSPSPVRAEIEALVMRCMAKDPAQRPQSARQLVELLTTLDHEPTDAARGDVASQTIQLPPDPIPAQPTAPVVAQPSLEAPSPAGAPRIGIWAAASAFALVLAVLAAVILSSEGSKGEKNAAAPGSTKTMVDAGDTHITHTVAHPPRPEHSPEPTASDSGVPDDAPARGPTQRKRHANARGSERPSPSGPRVAALVAEARDARGRSLLTQQSKAHAALLIQGSHPEALFLYGEALALGGYSERACKTLHRIRRQKRARQAAREAKCDWATGD